MGYNAAVNIPAQVSYVDLGFLSFWAYPGVASQRTRAKRSVPVANSNLSVQL